MQTTLLAAERCSANPPAAAAAAAAVGRTWTQRALLLLLLTVACSVSPIEARSTQVAGPAGSGDPGPQVEPPQRVAITPPHKGMGALAAALQQQQQEHASSASAASSPDNNSSETSPRSLGWDWDWASQSFRSLSTALRELASRPLVPVPAGPKHDLEGAIAFEREEGRVRSPGAAALSLSRGAGSASSESASAAAAAATVSSPHSRSSRSRSGNTAPIPVHRSSRAAGEPVVAPFVDNAPPSLMPTARLVAPLSSLEDGTHWVRVQLTR